MNFKFCLSEGTQEKVSIIDVRCGKKIRDWISFLVLRGLYSGIFNPFCQTQ